MRRRAFIAGLTVAAAWSRLTYAQSPVPAQRVVMLSAAANPESRLTEFRKQLKELGYVEGRNISFEFRSAEGHPERLNGLAEAIVREGAVNIILAESTPAAVAAHKATQTVPIVALVGVDPVASGLAESLARPGTNVTGITIYADEANAKRVELLRELAPGAVRLGAIMAITGNLNVATLQRSGEKLGFTVDIVKADPDHLSDALSPSILGGFDVFLVVPDIILGSRKDEIIMLIRQANKPAVFSEQLWAEAGGLIAFGPDIRDASRHWASQLARVLGGKKPSDVPFERPVKFDLRINMRTARRLAIEIPPTLLARADEVIE